MIVLPQLGKLLNHQTLVFNIYLLLEVEVADIDMVRVVVPVNTLSLNDDFMARLKRAGVSFVDVDNAAFQRATASVYKAFPNWTPGLHDTVMAALRK